MEKTLRISFDEALYRVPAALNAVGFGVMTEIDMQQALQKQLGAPFRRYRIFGSCNPALAREALEKDLNAGLLIPCNVVLYEERDHAVAVAIDPTQTALAQGGPELQAYARKVRDKLAQALEQL
jgi:uncharacterized protein (DUF302 family)